VTEYHMNLKKALAGPNKEYFKPESSVKDFVIEKCKSMFKEPLLSINVDFHNDGKDQGRKRNGYCSELAKPTMGLSCWMRQSLFFTKH
jgi:hypothetical protein